MRAGWAAALATLTLTGVALAQTAPPTRPNTPIVTGATTPLPAAVAQAASWEHAGSDIPADPSWRTGTLANGLRYVVRRNARPPGSISIRVRIDAGALMEEDGQQGWAHLVEHMTFRGTAANADGEGVKVWQRLGASFGSDTNAFTSLRSTRYVLDLPRADAASYREAMGVLAGMMTSARIDAAPLAVERQVVQAEGAARRNGLARELDVANRGVMYAGLKAGRRDILGTPATLGAADAVRLHAFYKHWYRPERAVVVVVGDADPALLETVVKEAFGGWQGEDPPPAEPDYGSVKTPAQPVALVTDPRAPTEDGVGWITPHDEKPFTVDRQVRVYQMLVTRSVLQQRLISAVQAGGAMLNAGITDNQQRHVADELLLTVASRPGQQRAALDQAFSIVNELRAAPPSQAEVDQQLDNLRGGLRAAVVDRTTELSSRLANEFVTDVDNGDVTPTPEFYLGLFRASLSLLTPAQVQRTLTTAFAGDPRMIRVTPDAAATAAGAAGDLTAARKTAAAADVQVRKVSLDELGKPATPGTVASRSEIADLGIARLRYANGVALTYKRTSFERGTIRLTVRIGHGLLSRAPNDPGLFWTAGALMGAGFGPYSRDELARLAAGHRLGFSISTGTDGIRLTATTSAADLNDVLRLMVAADTRMRYAEAPLLRYRDTITANYKALIGQPLSALSLTGVPYLYGGDTRFRALPPEPEIAALTPAAFQRFWTDELAKGPIRVTAVGDFDPDKLVAAVAQSFAALPARADIAPAAGAVDVRARKPAREIVQLHHDGDADQAVEMRVFPTRGVFPDLAQTRALDLVRDIVDARLQEQFRAKTGGTYSPIVVRTTSDDLPELGLLAAGAQLKVDRIAGFDAALTSILADLAKAGPTADELARVKATQTAAIDRSHSDNGFWLGILDKPLDDPRQADAVRSAITGRQALTVEDVRKAAARWLTPARGFTMRVLPTGK